jgi:putative ABC transport system substrate-binding protein
MKSGKAALLVLVAIGVLVTPPAAETQQAGKLYRVGVFVVSDGYQSNVNAFRGGLRDLGYVEGMNLVIEYRGAEGRYDRLGELAAELLQLNPEVVVTHSVPGTRAVEAISKTLPIVMATVGDAVETGLVKSLARPGGNITGLSFFFPALIAKRLELLKEAVPSLTRVALFVNPDNPGHQRVQMLAPLWTTARSLGLEVERADVRGREEVDSVFATISRRRVQGVVVLEDGVLNSHADAIVDLATRSRLATIGFKPVAMAGGLMGYAADHRDMWRRAAIFVDKILKGAKPADLPIEQATKFDLVINLKTARALGLTIPPSLLLRADQVIE